ncbi:hypothetical protein Bpfe_002947, partial [Biomphalaria pfeifferi]
MGSFSGITSLFIMMLLASSAAFTKDLYLQLSTNKTLDHTQLAGKVINILMDALNSSTGVSDDEYQNISISVSNTSAA